ncbi:Metastasis-associated protein MTA1 [Halotydeus destructor]|nr:Metastasis-associated protein MTA1 [Halotydeus destructor]
MYRVGDYVYFETSPTSPYLVRRIEELIKTPHGNGVEAKVMCFYRRRDISSSLVVLADKHQSFLEEEEPERETEALNEKQKHQLKHRELFLSRQIETIPATQLRGKCSVTLLNETESLNSYLTKEDSFFYTLVYDPQQKTLLADRGEIRVGGRFQAEVPTTLLADGESDGRDQAQLEKIVFTPEHALTDKEIDQFLTIAKSIGTFARALDHSSTIKQPSLHMSAAAASRDVTLNYAMDILHESGYDIGKAALKLVPAGGPVIFRDEMEDWSATEATLFEEAIEKYGKDFNEIRQDFLPWKTLRNIVEYYYMWKTTDRYVQQKRVKAVEAESKLKQVYIPDNFNKQANLNGLTAGAENLSANGGGSPGKACESCSKAASSQWFNWGPSHMQCRLCHSCWNYWKKFGGLKNSTRLDAEKLAAATNRPVDPQNPVYPCKECNKVFNRQERLVAHMAAHRPYRCSQAGCGKEFKFKAHLARHAAQAHGIMLRSGSPRPIVKTRAAFYLNTNLATKVSRTVCAHLFKARHFARKPFSPINATTIKQECQQKFSNGDVPEKPKIKPVDRGSVVSVSHKLGTPEMPCPEWLKATPKDQIPEPERLAFTPPPRDDDGKFIIPRPVPVEPKPESEEPPQNNKGMWGINNISPTINMRKRGLENGSGDGQPSSKRRQLAPPSILNNKTTQDLYGLPRAPLGHSINGRPKVATITRVGGRRQMISWVDAPDDVLFVATDSTRRFRRQLTVSEIRRGARRPWKRVGNKSVNTNGVMNGNHGNGLPTQMECMTTE